MEEPTGNQALPAEPPGEPGDATAGRSRGYRSFLLLWTSQVISILGSGMSSFALGVWVLQEIGSITEYTVLVTLAAVPGVVLSPLAGVWVDRFERRTMLIVSDATAAAGTVLLLVLYLAGRLEVWHLYPLAVVVSAAGAIQFPALAASVSLLVPKEQLGRANGLLNFARAGGQILSPLMAGFLLEAIELSGILSLDLATFLISILILWGLVRIPRPKASGADSARGSSFRDQVLFGWRYLRKRPALFQLLGFFALLNLLLPFCLVLTTPLVLTIGSPDDLGVVLAIASSGTVVGSVVMGAWGGPARKIYGIFGFAPLMAAGLVIAGWRPWLPGITVGMFLVLFTAPIVNALSQAIWQRKVEPDIQGRVFATRRAIAQGTTPIALLAAGPLADHLFEPAMGPDGALASSAGLLLGTGPGRGIGLMFVVLGVLFGLVGLAGFAVPTLRNLEDDLPDALDD